MNYYMRRLQPSLAVRHGGTMTAVRTPGSSYVDTIGKVNRTLFTSGALLTVKNGGIANNVTNSGGSVIIAIDGQLEITNSFTAENITISQGNCYISRGGILKRSDIIGGRVFVSSGHTISTNITSYGNLTVLKGGCASKTNLTSFGRLEIKSGGSAFDASSLFEYTSITISSGGVIDGVQLNTAENDSKNRGGVLYVSSGGKATLIEVIKGNVTIAGGSAEVLQIHSNGNALITNQKVTYTDYINAKNIINEGYLLVQQRATINSTQIKSGGTLQIDYGSGIASNTTVSSGGTMIVGSLAKALNTTVENGAVIIVSSGGTITYT